MVSTTGGGNDNSVDLVELSIDTSEEDINLHNEPTLVFRDKRGSVDQTTDVRGLSGDAIDPPYPWKIHGVQTKTVGRDKELDILRHAFQTAIKTRHVQLVNIVGDVGIGKSRLLSEFNKILDRHFDTASFVHCSGFSADPQPFAAFQKMIRKRFYILDMERGERACQKFLDGVRYIVDPDDNPEEIAHLVGFLVGLKFKDSPYVDVVADDIHRLREKASAALLQLFRADAKKNALVLAFDNLESADQESLLLIDYLYRNLAHVPVLIVTSGKPQFLDRQRSWTRLPTVTLAPLTPGNSRKLVEDILQLVEHVPDALIELVLKKSGGHPLAIEGIIRYLAELKVISTAEPIWTVREDLLETLDIPLTLKGVVSARLDELTPDEKSLLERAAVIGDTFWFGALLMLYRSEGELSPEQERSWSLDTDNQVRLLRETLDSLEKKDIISRSNDTAFVGEAEYKFKYAIERESILERREPRSNEAFHRLMAHWFEIHGSDHLDEYYEEVVHHYEHGGKPELAAQYMVRLAERAQRRYANQKAIKFYEKVTHLISEDDIPRKLEIFHELGNVHSLIGEYESALGYFQEMLRLSWIVGSRAKGGVGFNKMGRTYRELGEYDFAMSNFQQSLALFESVDDIRGIASNYDDMGRIHWLKGDGEKALGFHRKAAKLRREIGDKRSIALSLNNIGNIYLDRGDIKQAVRCFKEALELRREVGDKQGLTRSLNNLAVIFCERGKTEESIELWIEALRIAKEIGDREIQGILYANIGEAMITIGKPEEAMAYLTNSIRNCEAIGDRRPMADAYINLGRLTMLGGDLEKATEYSHKALAIAEYLGSKRLMGMAFKALGDIFANNIYSDEAPDESRDAETYYHRGIEILDEISCESELGKCYLSYGNYLIERGVMAKGKEILEKAQEIFDRLEMRPVLDKARHIIGEL